MQTWEDDNFSKSKNRDPVLTFLSENTFPSFPHNSEKKNLLHCLRCSHAYIKSNCSTESKVCLYTHTKYPELSLSNCISTAISESYYNKPPHTHTKTKKTNNKKQPTN